MGCYVERVGWNGFVVDLGWNALMIGAMGPLFEC